MLKNKKIKILIISLFIFVIGTNNVYAASYTGFDYTAKLYDNVNGTLTSVTTAGPTSGTGAYEGYLNYAANSSGGAWLISSPITLVANHTYTLTASIPNECGSLVLSNVNRIGVGTIINNAKASYQNNTDVNEIYSRVIGGNNFLIQFAFTPTINASYIVFPFATNTSCSSSRTILENIIIDDLGINSATEDQINTSLNNQTNEINNSIQNSTDTIINNQNQNNEELKDTINDNFNSCRPSVNLFDKNNIQNGKYINSTSGSLGTNGEWFVTDYIPINNVFTISGNNSYTTGDGVYAIYYDETKNVISSIPYSTYRQGITTLNAPSQAKYIKLSFRLENINSLQIQEGSVATEYDPYGEEICINKIDETNNQLGDLNNSLNNNNVDGSLNSAGSFFDNFSTTDHGGLSGIITAPLVSINQMLNTSCSPMSATFKGKELSFPCGYAFWNRLGAIQDFINIVLGGMLCYRIIIKLYKLIERIKNPEDDRLEVMDL